MKVAGILLLSCLGCGSLDKKIRPTSRRLQPCRIDLRYDLTQFLAGRDVPRYTAGNYSESCGDYAGRNLQTLTYRLDVHARESLGSIEEISIDGRQISLGAYALTSATVIVDDIDMSEVDNGPLQLESIWVTFAFPHGSEKALYPSKVSLTIIDNS